MGCFALNIGISYAFHAEIMEVIIAIESAYRKGWHQIWLECDSTLVIAAFSSPAMVPWSLRNMWLHALYLSRKISFLSSHVFREGNTCADLLANHGIGISGFCWWDSIPSFIKDEFLGIGLVFQTLYLDNGFMGQVNAPMVFCILYYFSFL